MPREVYSQCKSAQHKFCDFLDRPRAVWGSWLSVGSLGVVLFGHLLHTLWVKITKRKQMEGKCASMPHFSAHDSRSAHWTYIFTHLKIASGEKKRVSVCFTTLSIKGFNKIKIWLKVKYHIKYHVGQHYQPGGGAVGQTFWPASQLFLVRALKTNSQSEIHAKERG